MVAFGVYFEIAPVGVTVGGRERGIKCDSQVFLRDQFGCIEVSFMENRDHPSKREGGGVYRAGVLFQARVEVPVRQMKMLN